MKAILIWIAFMAILTESYSFVLSKEKTPIKPLPVTYLKNKTEYTSALGSSLCVDEHGHTIYGLVGYEKDCRKFVNCGMNCGNIMDCAAGTIFNKDKRSCDWPLEANCIEFRGLDKSKLVIPATDIIW